MLDYKLKISKKKICLWQSFISCNKDAQWQITKVCDSCFLLLKCQTTFGTFRMIQTMLGSLLNKCMKLCF